MKSIVRKIAWATPRVIAAGMEVGLLVLIFIDLPAIFPKLATLAVFALIVFGLAVWCYYTEGWNQPPSSTG